ncbi:MAG: hypothetical protein ACXWDO_05095 [Bacteroidia bacterium]
MKHSKTPLICMFSFLLTGMISCQKNLDVAPSSSLEKQMASGKQEFSIGLFMSGPEVLVGDSAVFSTWVFAPDINCGKVVLQKLNSKTKKWENLKNAEYTNVYSAVHVIYNLKLSDSGYYRWHYISGENCSFKSKPNEGLYLSVVTEYSEEPY